MPDGAGARGVQSTTADPVGQRTRWRLPLLFLQGVALYWIALKVMALFLGEPHADEAYYWLWGQHPALSYIDHAPFHGWLQGLVSLGLGWNLFALRFLSVVSAGVVLLILYVWARRIAKDDWRHHFWLSAALFYSTPLMLLYTTVAIHDRVLVACSVVAIHYFAWYFADWADGKRNRHGALYLAALFLGLATLTKYNGALLGVGVGVAILMRRDLWSLLRNPHLYLAALLSVAMQAPVIYWNATNGFPSLAFHLTGRSLLPLDPAHLNLGGVTTIALISIAVLSPIAIVAMAMFLFARAGQGFAGQLHHVARWVFIVSSVAFIVLALGGSALFYWNIVAYAAFFAVAAFFIRNPIAQFVQILYGAVLGAALFVHFSIVPVLPMVGVSQPDSRGLYGWEQIATAVRDAMAEHDAGFAAAPTWGLATRLAFALHDPGVASISESKDAFDFWFDDAAHAGMDAIVLTEPGVSQYLPWMERQFDSVESIGTIAVERFGEPMMTYELLLARNYEDREY